MRKPFSYKLFQFLSSIPVLLWPITFFLSIFVFDDPNADIRMQWVVFISFNVYPLLCIAALVISHRKYKSDEDLATALVVAPFVIFLFGILIFFLL